MKECCLVTGGAGFIGCAASRFLGEKFEELVVVDNLHPQVHARRVRPQALDPRAKLVEADICDPRTWDEVLTRWKPAVVLHLAAETGTGQSLTEASRHTEVNVVGLARLLDALAQRQALPSHVVLTSSRAVYGEGAWRRRSDGVSYYPGQRDAVMLEAGQWDFREGEPLPFSAGITEPHPTSIYGVTKLAQEQMLSCWVRAFGVGLSVLRLQNVYGPGQSLTNPYTGIVTLFARLAREGKSIPLYEDGRMTRDFVFIDDVCLALARAVARPPEGVRTVDIGSGRSTTIAELASIIAGIYSAPQPQVTGAFRQGDVRHASCSVELARRELDYQAQVSLDDGLRRLCAWMDGR
jgi:dTDP-L-rhamnose 4-epimerase